MNIIQYVNLFNVWPPKCFWGKFSFAFPQLFNRQELFTCNKSLFVDLKKLTNLVLASELLDQNSFTLALPAAKLFSLVRIHNCKDLTIYLLLKPIHIDVDQDITGNPFELH